MENRPKVELELTSFDKTIEIAGWISFVALWLYVLTNYSGLPAQIPSHFNAMGKIDDYSSKSIIIILPIIGSIIFIGLTILNKFPHLFNFPVQLTESNIKQQYTLATRMLRILKLAILLIFGTIAYVTIQSVSTKSDGPGVILLPVILLSVFIPIGYFIFKMIKTR